MSLIHLSETASDQELADAAGTDLRAPEFLGIPDWTKAVRACLFEVLARSGRLQGEGSPRCVDAGGSRMLDLDAIAADLVDEIGKTGKVRAKHIREASERRWRAHEACSGDASETASRELAHMWIPDGERVQPFLRMLVEVLLQDVFLPRLERCQETPAAVPVVVGRELARIHRQGNRLDEQRSVIVSKRGECVCSYDVAADWAPPLVDAKAMEAIRKGVPFLATLPAHRLLRFEVITAHSQKLAGAPDFRNIRIEGGFSGLSNVIGSPGSHRAVEQVTAILAAQAHLCIRLPDRTMGNLVSYRCKPASGQHPPTLTITVGDLLLPGAALSFDKGTRKGREARQLVPLAPMPPLVGHERTFGAQVNLQMVTLLEFRSRSSELLHGGVAISLGRWEEMADEAGLPRCCLETVVRAWADGSDTVAPFLKVVGSGVYTLADRLGGVLSFLVEGARRQVAGREGGRKGCERRRGRLMGPGGGKRSPR